VNQAKVESNALGKVNCSSLEIGIEAYHEILLCSSSIDVHETRADSEDLGLGTVQRSTVEIIIGELLKDIAVYSDPEILQNFVRTCEIHVKCLPALVTGGWISGTPEIMRSNGTLAFA
jgi:hypothetical protein